MFLFLSELGEFGCYRLVVLDSAVVATYGRLIFFYRSLQVDSFPDLFELSRHNYPLLLLQILASIVSQPIT